MDTHVHLQDFNSKNATDIINLAKKVGVSDFVCISATENDWEKIAQIAEQYPQCVIPAFGIHPWYAQNCSNTWQEKLKYYLQRYHNAVIGECGIDCSREVDINNQIKIFIKHIELAHEFKRPLIIHAVKGQQQIEKLWHLLPPLTIFHSYNSSIEFLRQIVAKGFYVGVNFSIVRNPNKEQILKSIPDNLLLLETDAPYQPMLKGEENSPTLLPELAKIIASIREKDIENFANQIYKNSTFVFKNNEIRHG